jgi:hypothetical protein
VLRRLLLLIVSSIITASVSAESSYYSARLGFCILLLGFLLVHVHARPYRSPRDNTLETASLSVLLLIASVSSSVAE